MRYSTNRKNHSVEKNQWIVSKLSKSTRQTGWNAKVIVFAHFGLRSAHKDPTLARLHRDDPVMC
jgi:hypothetical protein